MRRKSRLLQAVLATSMDALRVLSGEDSLGDGGAVLRRLLQLPQCLAELQQGAQYGTSHTSDAAQGRQPRCRTTPSRPPQGDPPHRSESAGAAQRARTAAHPAACARSTAPRQPAARRGQRRAQREEGRQQELPCKRSSTSRGCFPPDRRPYLNAGQESQAKLGCHELVQAGAGITQQRLHLHMGAGARHQVRRFPALAAPAAAAEALHRAPANPPWRCSRGCTACDQRRSTGSARLQHDAQRAQGQRGEACPKLPALNPPTHQSRPAAHRRCRRCPPAAPPPQHASPLAALQQARRPAPAAWPRGPAALPAG